MVYAAVFFFGSLIGIGVLFAIKSWEVSRGRVLSPAARTRADRGALQIKALIDVASNEAKKVPPALVYIARLLLHETALGTAALARTLERQAHRLADVVSHKHRFERRESRSEFLRQMNGHALGRRPTGETLRDPRDITPPDAE